MREPSTKRKMVAGLGGGKKRICMSDCKENIPPEVIPHAFIPKYSQQQLQQQHENRLILEHIYPLNNTFSKWLCIGLNPQDKFSIVVKITNSNILHGVCFNMDDWNEFMQCRDLIMGYIEGKNNVEYQSLRVHKLHYQLIQENVKVISIQSMTGEICLSVEHIKKIFFELAPCVSYYIQLLLSEDFNACFTDLISRACISGDLLNVEYGNNLCNFAMKEMLQTQPQLINENLNSYYN